MTNIPIDKIIPNPMQPRMQFNQDEMESLTDSIRQHGIINPISVEEYDGGFVLIDGERRWRAAGLAGLVEIPAMIRPSTNGNGKEKLILAIVANLQRADMNVVEEGISYGKLKDFGYTYHEIAKIVGRSVSSVRVRLMLVDLDPEIQALFASGGLVLHDQVIRSIKLLPDEKRVRIARRLAQKNATMKTIINVCNRIIQEKDKTFKPILNKSLERKSWTALDQLKHDPKLKPYEASATATCKACALYEDAGPNTCRDCPAVELLKRLIS